MAGNVLPASSPCVSVQSTAFGSRDGPSLRVPRMGVPPPAMVTAKVSPAKAVRGSRPTSSGGSATPPVSQETCRQAPWNFARSSVMAPRRRSVGRPLRGRAQVEVGLGVGPELRQCLDGGQHDLLVPLLLLHVGGQGGAQHRL